MSLVELLLYGLAGACLIMSVGWVWSLKVGNATCVDVIWAYGVGILGCLYLQFASPQTEPVRLMILNALIVVWSVRLGTYQLIRSWGKQEDVRYKYMREWLGGKANLGFFIFFQMQAVFIVIFASPFLILAGNNSPVGTLDFIGLAIWFIGFTGVFIADRQLTAFKATKGRTRAEVCQSGLWKYSRHPNYFFEWVLWLGYVFIGWHSEEGAWLLAIPLVLYVFLNKITGIPFVEARKLEASGENYRSYVDKTSPFFPWFPKPSNEH